MYIEQQLPTIRTDRTTDTYLKFRVSVHLYISSPSAKPVNMCCNTQKKTIERVSQPSPASVRVIPFSEGEMQEGQKRLATLVGCNYPNTQHELHGCINDVHAMSDVLVARFGFHRNDILVLTDASGSPLLPTGANIKSALAAMIARAVPGDVLFFHYSGHGTLIPAVKPHHSWHSHHDEAIVPCDFNLITDVDFRQLIDGLPTGVSFTMISDSCHSGGLIDQEKEQIGPSTTIDRTVVPQRPRIIPFNSILDHLSSLSGIDSPHIGDHLSTLFGAEASAKYSKVFNLLQPLKPDNGILLSGCQANETSADMSPEYGGEDKAYGAFSNSIQMVLKGHEGVLSNRELVTRARALLRSQGFQQHPCLYCSDENADAPFLWQLQGPLRSSM